MIQRKLSFYIVRQFPFHYVFPISAFYLQILSLSVSLAQSITSEDQLSSLTKTRARPANRRPPSRQRTPSPSPRRHESSAPSPGRHESSAPSPPTTPVTRVGGITGISADSANVSEEAWPDLDATTMKQQWVSRANQNWLISLFLIMYT